MPDKDREDDERPPLRLPVRPLPLPPLRVVEEDDDDNEEEEAAFLNTPTLRSPTLPCEACGGGHRILALDSPFLAARH